MNKKFATKESLLLVGIGAISSGIMLIPTMLLQGVVLVGVGAGCLVLRSYLKIG